MFSYFLKKLKKVLLIACLLFAALLACVGLILYVNIALPETYDAPERVFEYVEKHAAGRELFTAENRRYLAERSIWAMHLDRDGEVVESFRKPKEVKDRFTLTDVAGFSRFYLNDYPVFTYIAGEGLIVFGYPKGSLDRFPVSYYNFDHLLVNLKLVAAFVVLFFVVIFCIYRYEMWTIKKQIVPLQEAIRDIFSEDFEPLAEDDELREIAASVNEANARYRQLAESRATWIRGVSHDVRTPLAKLNWNLESLEAEDEPEKIEAMKHQVMQVSKIVEDLNLTTRLETLNTREFKAVSPVPVVRKLVVDAMNEHPERAITFDNRLTDARRVSMDPHLFSRMIENVLRNALRYTRGRVSVRMEGEEDRLVVAVEDEGEGISREVLDRLETSDTSNVHVHGLGLLISKQICEIHRGTMRVASDASGTRIRFSIPFNNTRNA
ncbi:MAG: HAMP domain-containing sensor histidine kinase [Peptoniphilus sp.]|nr:HAMP domain-containing sensor histidine kinase [Peptoniphilus sp.]MDD7362649.1 HAMP domain-containing sensor histidine kinase [Bacillota bacterium]MDY6044952.1 HAMP domain-containing sensor histidine kinase [Peptoniphilus sp.]